MMSWLPCFMVAANAMGMKMALESALPNTAQTAEHVHMSCHDGLNHIKTSDNKTSDSKTSPTSSHHCSLCAFCVVGSAIASTPKFKMTHVKTTNIQPASHDVAFTSQDYPPAIKPPILN
jgi:hypothetical protein